MKKHIIIAFISLGLIGVLITLFTKVISYSNDDHWKFITLLREARQKNSELNESVLKSSLSIRKDYDRVVLLTKDLSQITDEISTTTQAYEPEFIQSSQKLSDAVISKLKFIELFKSKNAVLRNSSTYFDTIGDELFQKSNKIKSPKIKSLVGVVAWNSHLFLRSLNESSLNDLNISLQNLKQAAGPNFYLKDRIADLELHRDIINRHRAVTANAIKSSTNLDINNIADSMEALYQKKLKKINARNVDYQTIMLLISVLLFAYTVLILFKLWKTMANLENRVKERTHALEESNQIIQSQQKNLVYSSKMSALGEMAGGVAHEINNPLAIIALSCNTLKKMMSKEQFDRQYLVENILCIENTTDRIAKIVKGLRTFSRNEVDSELSETTIKHIMDDTLTLCQEKFKNHGIELKLELQNENSLILCNPISISQVLLNLLNNSCDAIEKLENKWIKIESRILNHEAYIEVTDCGAGIPLEILQKIMDPFFTTKEIGRGTGLGLSISKGIMESHSGSLKYDHSCKNTKFVISLPTKKNVVQNAS